MISFLLKRIIITYIMLYIPQLVAESSSLPDIKIESHAKTKNIFSSDNEKLSYSLGISFGNYINQSFEKQEKIGIKLNKDILLKGIQDSIEGKLKLSHEEIILSLKKLENQLKSASKIELQKNIKEHLIEGELYMEKLSKEKGVKKTSSGLLYVIKEKGQGEELTNDSKITVHYKGTLINGVEFDNSYIRGKPISFFLKDVILGWQEGLKYIKKGGKIKLIIPPHLGYGIQDTNEIPGNSTLIFDIELLDVINKV